MSHVYGLLPNKPLTNLLLVTCPTSMSVFFLTIHLWFTTDLTTGTIPTTHQPTTSLPGILPPILREYLVIYLYDQTYRIIQDGMEPWLL